MGAGGFFKKVAETLLSPVLDYEQNKGRPVMPFRPSGGPSVAAAQRAALDTAGEFTANPFLRLGSGQGQGLDYLAVLGMMPAARAERILKRAGLGVQEARKTRALLKAMELAPGGGVTLGRAPKEIISGLPAFVGPAKRGRSYRIDMSKVKRMDEGDPSFEERYVGVQDEDGTIYWTDTPGFHHHELADQVTRLTGKPLTIGQAGNARQLEMLAGGPMGSIQLPSRAYFGGWAGKLHTPPRGYGTARFLTENAQRFGPLTPESEMFGGGDVWDAARAKRAAPKFDFRQFRM